jgi:hypothetical protein
MLSVSKSTRRALTLSLALIAAGFSSAAAQGKAYSLDDLVGLLKR